MGDKIDKWEEFHEHREEFPDEELDEEPFDPNEIPHWDSEEDSFNPHEEIPDEDSEEELFNPYEEIPDEDSEEESFNPHEEIPDEDLDEEQFNPHEEFPDEELDEELFNPHEENPDEDLDEEQFNPHEEFPDEELDEELFNPHEENPDEDLDEEQFNPHEEVPDEDSEEESFNPHEEIPDEELDEEIFNPHEEVPDEDIDAPMYAPDKKPDKSSEKPTFNPDAKPQNKIEPKILPPNYTPKNKIRPHELPTNHKPRNKIERSELPPNYTHQNKIERPTLPPNYNPKNTIKPPELSPNIKSKNEFPKPEGSEMQPSKKKLTKTKNEQIQPQNVSNPKTHQKLYNDGERKECGRCHEIKQYNNFEFRRDRRKENGYYRSICKNCRNEFKQIYALSNKYKIVQNIYNGKFKRKCQKCNTGVEKLPSFDFHHPNPELKSQRIKFGHKNWEGAMKKLEKERVNLECKNCHTQEQAKNYYKYERIIQNFQVGNQNLKQIEKAIQKHVKQHSDGIPVNDRPNFKRWVRKNIVISKLYNGKCVACEQITIKNNLPGLQFHHKNLRNPNRTQWKRLLSQPVPEIVKKLKSENCVAICANCQTMIHSHQFKKNHESIVGSEYWDQIKQFYKITENNIRNFKFN